MGQDKEANDRQNIRGNNVGYFYNHTRDTHKLYNPETKRVIITRDIKWVDWKITNTLETLKMFQEPDKEDLVPGIW